MFNRRTWFALVLALALATPAAARAHPTGFELAAIAAPDSVATVSPARDPWRVTEIPPHRASDGVELARADASPRAALAVSLVSTLVPVALGTLMLANSTVDTGAPGLLLIGTGLVVGPATGYASAGMNRSAGAGLAVRGLTAVLAVGVAAANGQGRSTRGFDNIGFGIVLVGATGVVVSTSAVRDLVLLPEAVERGRTRRLELESH